MKRAKFDRLMDGVGSLPTLPIIAQKILSIVHHEQADYRVLTEIIELDPAISARVLRLANSAYFRTPHAPQVADIHRAVVVLGLVNIRNIVLTTCLRSLYAPEFRTFHFSARDLWIHSVTVALISRRLAMSVAPVLADEAFLAGVMHDVGMIVEWSLFPRRFPQVLLRFQGTGKDFLTAERETFGFDHCVAGATVLRKWGLPKHIREATAHHHKVRRRKGDNLLPEMVHAAERVCCVRGDGFFDFVGGDQGTVETLAALGLADDGYGALLEQTEEELGAARELLSL